MVKDIIIEEKNCFSDDSARRFMQTIQQMSCNISNSDLSLHSSPSRPYPLCLSGFREVKSFLYLFTHSSPLFTHIEIHYTQYGKKKSPGAIRIGSFFYAPSSKGAAWWGYDRDSVCLYLTYRFYSGFVSKKPINSSKSRRMSVNLGLLF